MFSTRTFLEQELARIDYLNFVDQNVSGLAGKMRPMPREIENRVIYHINNKFRRSFFVALATIIDGTFEEFRNDAEVRRRVNQIDEFFARNGLSDSLLEYYKGQSVNAFSFSQWFYDFYLFEIKEKILKVSSQLASRIANNLNEIAERTEINDLILLHNDFGPDGFPKRTPEVQQKQRQLIDFLSREYTALINEKIREIVDGSGQFFADPVLEAIEDLVGMKSSIRERLVRVIERRHDARLNTTDVEKSAFATAAQSSHFEDLSLIVTKAIGVSEYLKVQLTNEKGDEIQRELDQHMAAVDAIKLRIEKDAADFASRIERWAA